MANEGSSAASGGLLVVLGIIVALGAVFAFGHFGGGSSGPDVSINATLPKQ